jgi:uncharacterized protein YjgD (DUF1641 family)
MAKPIRDIEKQVPNAAVEEAQAMQEVLRAAVKHKDALLELFELVNELHEAGLLEAANALLQNRHKVGVIGITQLNKSGAQRMIKNGMSAVQVLGKLDPQKVEQLLGGVASGVDHAVAAKQERPAGLWGMVKQMRDPQVQSSLGVMLNFLRGMGNGMQKG